MGILQPNRHGVGDGEQKDTKTASGQWMVEVGAANGRRDKL